MRLRIPRPLHGWREFAGEVGIIVLGVLIALAVEQAASAVRDDASRREAREAVYSEINQNLSYMTARMETQPCVERRLKEIGLLLANARDGTLSPEPKWSGPNSRALDCRFADAALKNRVDEDWFTLHR